MAANRLTFGSAHTFFRGACSKTREIVNTAAEKIFPADDAVIELDTSLMTRVRHSALPGLSEYALIAISAAANSFLLPSGTNWYRNPLLFCSPFIIANFLIRSLPVNESANKRRALRFLRSAIFAFVDRNTRAIIWHELAGHALAATSLFNNSNSAITIYPVVSGYSGATICTACTPENLSSFGKMIGLTHSPTLFTAAGPGVALLWDCISLVIAQVLGDEHPEIRSHLRASVMMSLFTSLEYAFSAYGECTSIQDFCNLKKAGITPAAMLSILLSIMLLVQMFLSLMISPKKDAAEDEQAVMLSEIQIDGNVKEERKDEEEQDEKNGVVATFTHA